MDTKDTGIKQEPTAPGAEGNDGGFPQNNPAECGVCFTLFDDTERRPRTLPCGHTFCTECIKVMMTTRSLTCPSCQSVFKTENINQFPVNYTVETLVKYVKSLTLPKPSQNTTGPGTTITPSLKKLVLEQNTIMDSVVEDSENLQSHLIQYRKQLADWQEQHIQNIEKLRTQNKSALDLLDQEDCRVKTLVGNGKEIVEKMKATQRRIQGITNGEEAFQVINQACHCTDEDQEWKEKCQELFPDVITVTTSKKVRDVTNKALMMVDGEAGATQHTNQLSDFTLPLMDKVDILLNDNIFEELEEVKPDNRGNQNDYIYFKVTLEDKFFHFHCLQNQNLPPETLTLPVSEMVKRLKPDYTFTFLDMAWSGRRERVYIKVNSNTTEARQFVDLCTGQRGSFFFNTQLTRVWNKGKAGECVFGGNYDIGLKRMLSSNGCCGEGTVMFMSHTEESGEFIINTNGKSPKFGIVIGLMWKGLKVLQEVAQLSDITQVTVVNCGVGVIP